jgi:hypothetical protein
MATENVLVKKHNLKSLRGNITRLSQELIDSHTTKQITNLQQIKLEPRDFNIKVENVDPLAIKFEPAPRDVDFSCSENLHTQNLEAPAIKCEADVDLTDSEQLTSELMIKDEHVECSEDEHDGEWIQKPTAVNNIVCKNTHFY